MSNQIEFNNLWNLMPEIFSEVSKENSSQLLNCRLVSNDWKEHCETLFRTLWEQLNDNRPQGVVNMLSNMNRIDGEHLDGGSALLKFKKLAAVFKKHKINPETLPIRISDFQSMQNTIHDNALKTIWPRLLPILASAILQAAITGPTSITKIPTAKANTQVIRTFLNDPNLSTVLAIPIPALDLSELSLEVVPPELERLSGLRVLDLSGNRLSEVPNFNNLQNLTELDLEGNQLKEVPNFNNLQNLTGLILDNNQLEEVPNFNNLQNLTGLILANNRLEEVPNFNNLQNLTGLFLANNRLKEVPNFNNLQNLTALDLANNQLREVPNFSNLQNLTGLDLDGNQLREIPHFNNLQNLTALNLANNKLKEVPNFSNLQNLTELYLDGNILMVIPDAILQRFPTNEAIRLFTSQLAYKCQSSLAFLYQTILAGKEIGAAFNALIQQDKNLIFVLLN